MSGDGSSGSSVAVASRSERIAGAIADFQAGAQREESFRVLYEAYFPAVRRFFLRKGAAPEDCLDLAQETFLGVYRGLDGYRMEARFESWLYRVATTTYLKRLRAEKTAKRSGRELVFEEAAPVDPASRAPARQLERVLDEEQRRAMWEAVVELPTQMRRCLTLRLYHGLKYREIAIVMRLSIETVKVHLHQAKKRLDDALGEDPDGDDLSADEEAG